MNHYCIRQWVFVTLLGGIFVLGFVSGSVSQRPAQAQIPGMGGALGSLQELGSSIVEMQLHVDGLQKTLATLKKVQIALGGGKKGGPSQAERHTLYAILACLPLRAFRAAAAVAWHWRWATLSLLLVAIYAGLDEYHQTYTQSRTGAVSDSLLDIAGGLLALTFLWLYWRVRRRASAPQAATKRNDPPIG